MRNKEVLINGLNKGDLGLDLVYEFVADGYAFICNDGVLVDIVLEKAVAKND